MYKIGVIGDKDSVIGFLSVGFKVFFADDREEAAKTLKTLSGEDYAIVFITENLACQMEDELLKYRDRPVPAVIVIPGKDGTNGYGISNIKKSVERAVGADILFKEQKK